jgi:DNA modification methylase
MVCAYVALRVRAGAAMSLPYVRMEQIGDCTLYQGDCRDILPTLGKVDAVVTDPPYGIRADENPVRGVMRYGESSWDRKRPPAEIFTRIREISRDQIVWGGNYFTDSLPPSMRWLVWDKGQREFSLADVELAWTSQNKAARAITFSRGAALKDGKKHPTQKPIEVMAWCLGFLPEARTILDPFMGSGTTGVACVQMGRSFIGIELDPGYFDIACKRIADEVARPRLDLGEPMPKPVQEVLL